MLLKYTKFVTPTMRHRTREVFFSNIANEKAKKLVSLIKRKSGRNFSGQITTRSRRSSIFGRVSFHEYVDIGFSKFFFKEFIYNKLTKKLSVSLRAYCGSYFLLPATKNTSIGKLQSPFYNHNLVFQPMSVGLPTYLKNIPIFFKFSNLAPHSTIRLQYAVSPGTFMTKVKAPKKEKLLKTILPSKQIHFFKQTSYVLPGVNWDKTSKNFEPGKAGYSFYQGFRPTVRGVAKNPVDHPNGGRTKTCKPEKTPWGWVAKNNK